MQLLRVRVQGFGFRASAKLSGVRFKDKACAAALPRYEVVIRGAPVRGALVLRGALLIRGALVRGALVRGAP